MKKKDRFVKLVFFIHQDASDKGTFFQETMVLHFKGCNHQVVRTIDAFKTALKKPASIKDKAIFILFADTENRLKTLSDLIYLLEGKRLIVIIPDESNASLSVVHRFYPRFYTQISDTYADLCAVLTKMTTQ